MLTLEQLQQFLMVAKLSSFTKAAEALFVSHSTISRSIAVLEQELGVTLLLRDTRSVSLTYAGRVLYEKGAVLIKQIEAMERDVQKASKGVTGLMNVACVSFYEESLFGAFRRFRREHEEIDMILHHHSTAEVVQEVLFDRVDMGVTYSYALGSARESFYTVPVASGRFCIVASKEYDPEQLKKYGTPEFGRIKVLAVKDLLYEFVEGLASIVGSVHDHEVYQTTTLESLLLQIRSGGGVALLPEHVARAHSEGYQIVELERIDSAYDIVFFSKKSNQNPTLSIFYDWYQKQYK